MELLLVGALLILAIALAVLYRTGGSRLAGGIFAVVAIGSLAWAALPSTSATATNPIALTITPVDLNPANEVALEGSTYTTAKNTLTSPSQTSATIIVALVGLPPTTVAAATVNSSDANRSLSLVGTGAVLGIPGAQIALTATWPSAASTDPDVAVMVRFNSIKLSELSEDWPTDMDLTLGPAILGMTTSNHTVDPNVVPGVSAFMSDGIGATDDAFPMTAGSLNMQAAITNGGAIGDSTEELGGDGTGVRIRGVLSASVGLLDETDATPPTAGLELTLDFTVATPTDFPDWITLNDVWTLTLSIDSNGDFAATFSGGATVMPDGETAVEVTGEIALTVTNGGADFTLGITLEIGEYPNLFGQDWLDLNGATVSAELAYAGGSFSFTGGIEAGITLGPVVTELSLELTVAPGTTEATIDFAIVEPVSVADIMEAVDAPTGANPTLESLTLNAASVHVEIVSATGSPTEVVFSLFASASITINSGTFTADVLFRMSTGAEPTDLLIAARLDSPNLSDLIDGGFDWELPDIALIASTADREDNSADLDPPTFQYFAPVYCGENPPPYNTGNCDFDLEVEQGLIIQAIIELPQDTKDALSELGVNVSGPLEITGKLPILGATEARLEVKLPPVDNTGSTPATGQDELVQSAEISFFISYDTVTKKMEAGIEGAMVFRISRSDQGTCGSATNPEDGEFSTGDCYDTVDLTVTASVIVEIGSVEIQLQGTVANWNNAFGQEWLDIQEFTLQVGIVVAPPSGVSLTVGVLGRLKFGVAPNTKDLTLAVKVGITPTPPWITLLGLTVATHDGVSVQDVATLLGLDASGIPDVSLKNLWFSYGTEMDEDLCIRAGFYFTAEIHLNAESSSGADPGCLPDEDEGDGTRELPTETCALSDTCLAAVLFEVTTTGSNPGFTAAAFIGGFQIGPLIIDDTEIELTIKLQEQRFRFKGGGTLLDPTTITTDEWASGELEVDFQNNGGAVTLYVYCNVELGGGSILSATVTGNIAVDFSLLEGATPQAFLEFFNSVEFDLTVTLKSDALEELGNTISQGLAPVATWAEDTATEAEGAYNDAVDYFTGYCAMGADCEAYLASQDEFDDFQAYFDAIQNGLYDEITAETIGIYDIIIPPSVCDQVPSGTPGGDCHERWGNYAKALNQQVVDNNGGANQVAWYGLHTVFTIEREDSYAGTNIGFPGFHNALAELDADDGADPSYLVAPTRFNWTGACEVGGNLYGQPVCSASPETQEFLAELIGPIIKFIIVDETGYSLPADVDGYDALVLLNTYFPAPPPPAPLVLDGENRIVSSVVTLEYLVLGCASTTYSSLGNTANVGNLTVQGGVVAAPGVNTGFTTPLDTTGNPGTTAMVQGTISDVTDPNNTVPTCLNAETPNNPGQTTLSVVGGPNKNEGESFGLQGQTSLTSGTVTIEWGDGSPNSVVGIGLDGKWSSPLHTYADDPGPGSPNQVQIRAQVTGSDSDDWRINYVNVFDVAPQDVTVVMNPSPVESLDDSTATVTWTDPGSSDTFEVVIDWGDGSTPTTISNLPAGTTSTQATHSFLQPLPIGQPSTNLTVTATVTDKDGLSGTGSTPLTVQKPQPPVTTIIGTKSGGGNYAFGTWTNKDVLITLLATDTGRPPQHIYYGLDNPACAASWPGAGSCTLYTGPFVVSAEGVHGLYFFSTDAKTAEYYQFVEIKIRKIAPTVSLNVPPTPPNQSNYFNKNNAPVPVLVTATDPSGVTGIQCTVNGQPVNLVGVTGTNTTTMTGTLPVGADGTAVVAMCVATNGAGVPAGAGPGSVNTRTLKIDATPPTVTVTGVTNNATYTMGQVPAAGCTTSDSGSGVQVNATRQLTGGNANGAGAFQASCVGGKDLAGNTTPPVIVNYTVVCPPTMLYRGTFKVKFNGSTTYQPTSDAIVKLNAATCDVLGISMTSAAATGSVKFDTTTWTKSQPAAGQWQFTMKTPSLAAGSVFTNGQYRVLDGSSKLLAKFVNGRLQLYMKLTGAAPTGVGLTKVNIEGETAPTGILLAP